MVEQVKIFFLNVYDFEKSVQCLINKTHQQVGKIFRFCTHNFRPYRIGDELIVRTNMALAYLLLWFMDHVSRIKIQVKFVIINRLRYFDLVISFKPYRSLINRLRLRL